MNDYDVTIPETLPIIVYYNSSLDKIIALLCVVLRRYLYIY